MNSMCRARSCCGHFETWYGPPPGVFIISMYFTWFSFHEAPSLTGRNRAAFLDTMTLDMPRHGSRSASRWVDQSTLHAVAAQVLGERALAVTATSETYPERELREAKQLAARIGGRHQVIVSEELDIPGFAENPKDRCYHCKNELFTKLRKVAEAEGLPHVADGSNVDDRGDYRPGRQAMKELGVIKVPGEAKSVAIAGSMLAVAADQAGLVLVRLPWDRDAVRGQNSLWLPFAGRWFDR